MGLFKKKNEIKEERTYIFPDAILYSEYEMSMGEKILMFIIGFVIGVVVGFIFCSQRGLPLATFTVMSPRSRSDQRANDSKVESEANDRAGVNVSPVD